MLQGIFRERRRSLAVRSTGLLDTPAEAAFDRFVDAAASAFNAPVAMLSLIYDDRQWFKATRGLSIDCMDRDQSLCNFTLDGHGLLETCEPDEDVRFSCLPAVAGPPHIRYYIGAPLQLLSGLDVGTLCVADTARRQPASADQKAYLLGLARQVSMAIETRLDLVGNAA